PANDFVSFHRQIDLGATLVATDDGGLDAQSFVQQAGKIMTRGARPRATAARRLFGVAQIINGFERRVRSDVMHHIILFRRTDPGKFGPVEPNLRATDELLEIKARIKRAES